jgi:hypothetical protein
MKETNPLLSQTRGTLSLIGVSKVFPYKKLMVRAFTSFSFVVNVFQDSETLSVIEFFTSCVDTEGLGAPFQVISTISITLVSTATAEGGKKFAKNKKVRARAVRLANLIYSAYSLPVLGGTWEEEKKHSKMIHSLSFAMYYSAPNPL